MNVVYLYIKCLIELSKLNEAVSLIEKHLNL